MKFYIRKLKQLPTNLSVDADPTKMLEAIKEEEADLSTPVQQKLLKRISGDVNPKREPVTPARKRGITPSVPIKKEADQLRSWRTDTLTRAPPQTLLTRPLIFTTKVILLISNNIYHTTLIRKGLAGMEPSKSLKVLSTQNFRG